MPGLRTKTISIAAAILLMTAGCIVLLSGTFTGLFKELASHVLSEESFRSNPPGVYAIINNYLGSILILFSACILLGLLANPFLKRHEVQAFTVILFVFLVFFLVCGFGMIFQKSIEIDEIEHIHSTWYVAHGQVPYRDFFQHHHPLLWYCLSPVLFITGEAPETLFVMRMFMYAMMLGISYAAYRMSREAGASRETALCAVVFLVSTVIFMKTGIETRPDIPQTFLGMVSFVCFLKFMKTRRPSSLIICGLAVSISFLFLQKAVIFVLFYLLVLLIDRMRRKKGMELVTFSISFLIPVLLFGLMLLRTGSWHDYYVTNIALNVKQVIGDSHGCLVTFLIQNSLHGILLVVSYGVLFIQYQKTKPEQKWVLWMGLIAFLYPILLKRSYERYFFPAIPLLAVTAGMGLERLLRKPVWNHRKKIALVFLIVIIPSTFMVKNILTNYNRNQLNRIRFALENTEKTDTVYDGIPYFNLFRKDLHYFWFSADPNGTIAHYNAVTKGRYAGYDIVSLICEKRPKLITNYKIDMNDTRLTGLYSKAPVDDIQTRIFLLIGNSLKIRDAGDAREQER